MSTLSRGAPLDIEYINRLVNIVEAMQAAMDASPYQQTSITNGMFDASGAKLIKTSEARIHAETISLGSDFAAGTSKAFSVPLSNFEFTPVATVTPIVNNVSSNNYPISVSITSVSQNAVNGKLFFHQAVDKPVGISVIVVGVASSSSGNAVMPTNQFYMTPTVVA